MNKPLAAAACALALAGYCRRQNNALCVGRYTVNAGLPRPVVLVQLADLHGKRFGPEGRRLVDAVRPLTPDLIVLTGDTVGADCKNLIPTARLLKALCAQAPVFLIPGNHERRSGRWRETAALFRAQGVAVLENERFDGAVNGVPLHILGLAEPQAVSSVDYLRCAMGTLRYQDNRAALARLAALDGLRIVLCHFPENFARIGALSYCRFAFDLMLSGHAHGGQFRLPFFGGVYAPGQGLLPRYDAGMFGRRPALIVSRGLGNDTILPRVNNRPEIVRVTIR